MSKTIEQIMHEGTPKYCSIIHAVEQYKAGNCPLSVVESAVTCAFEYLKSQLPAPAGDAVGFAEWKLDRYVHARNHPSFETQLWNPMHDKRPFGARAEFTTSQLYAKFREEHPQPAGASVEQAWQDYKKKRLETMGNAHVWRENEAKENFEAGAAFQSAPGIPAVKELVDKAESVVKTYKVWNDEPRRLAEMLHGDIEELQTALAGFKRK